MSSTGLPGVVVPRPLPTRAAPTSARSSRSPVWVGDRRCVGILSMFAIALNPVVLRGWGPMLIILGCWAVTNFVPADGLRGPQVARLRAGTATQGIALGFLLLVAVLVSRQDFGNPFVLIGMAIALTVVAGIGIASYAMVERHEFRVMRAALGAVFLPMLVLMGVTFASRTPSAALRASW